MKYPHQKYTDPVLKWFVSHERACLFDFRLIQFLFLWLDLKEWYGSNIEDTFNLKKGTP